MNAQGIETNAKMIVNKLKLIKTTNAKKHKLKTQIIAALIEILFEAKGRSLVLRTFLSKSLSIMSFTIQPADRINKDPRKKRLK